MDKHATPEVAPRKELKVDRPKRKKLKRLHLDKDTQSKSLIAKLRLHDQLFSLLALFFLAVAMLCLTAIIVEFAISGFDRLNLDFLTSFPSRRAARAGVLSAWVGSIMVMSVTIAVAVPLGIGAGIYLEEYAAKNLLTDFIELCVANLAGVPSIIYGLLALGIFIYGFGLGASVATAGLTLGILVLPIVTLVTREAFRSIPIGVYDAAYGLGADKWQLISSYLLPVATPRIMTGVIIALSRAIGETAPLVTIGALSFISFLPPFPISLSWPFLNFEYLSSGYSVLPMQMYNWISRPQIAFHENAAAAGLILISLTLILNTIAIAIRYRLRKVS